MMLGLRTVENEKFKRFFLLVQEEAAEKDAVFFLESGQGKLFENEVLECEDLCGWLIPNQKVPEFIRLFEDDSDKVHDFDNYFAYVDFAISEAGVVSIHIDI